MHFLGTLKFSLRIAFDFPILERHPSLLLSVDLRDLSKAKFIVRSISTASKSTAHYVRVRIHVFRDGLGNITARHPDLNVPTYIYSDETPHPQLAITDQSAASIVLDLIKHRPLNSVTYVTIGPLTSLAQILRADDGTFRNGIGRIFCMGGALDVPGNTSPVAECKGKVLSIKAILTRHSFSPESQLLRRPLCGQTTSR
jgi:hypothetical protein